MEYFHSLTHKQTKMKKVETLFPKKESELKEMNIFEKKVFEDSHVTTSGNGSRKLTTSGNIFLDDFAAISNFRELRDLDDIFQTMYTLFNKNALLALKETCYIRMITREPKYLGTKLGTHRGQGLKHEYIGRLLWLYKYHRQTFLNNMEVFIAIGSYEDLFNVMRYALEYNVHVKINSIIEFLTTKQNEDLCKKYAPAIVASKKCTTLRKQANNIIAKRFAEKLFGNKLGKKNLYMTYNRWKSSGTATQFQACISREEYDKLDFNTIPGRALAKLVSSKFLVNHNLEDVYNKWISSQPIAKFTGYPYELFAKDLDKKYQIDTVNKQFLGLIETAKKDMDTNTSFIVCVDSSGSMECLVNGLKISSLKVAQTMALYFSYLLKGKFANTYLEFNRTCEIKKFVGSKPYEKLSKLSHSGFYDTNIFSVAELFVELRKKGYDEKEFPTGIILISDGEFNNPQSYRKYDNGYNYRNRNNSSLVGKDGAFDVFIDILRKGGFSEEFIANFKLILWDIPNSFYASKTTIRTKFEALGDHPNYFYMSGLDPAGIAFMTGKETKEKPLPKTAEELFEAAMNQELLQKIVL